MTRAARRPALLVLAGVNGAGKSSVAGAWWRAQGHDFYDPDEAGKILRASGVDPSEVNAIAWEEGRRQLEDAIVARSPHAFETTLGGNTIPSLIRRACSTHEVTIWFVGLQSPDLHVERVRQRVLRGGHHIPEDKIRDRWKSAPRNLIALMPHLYALYVYDNSEERPAEPRETPILVLSVQDKKVKFPGTRQLAATPAWAQPIVEAALQLQP